MSADEVPEFIDGESVAVWMDWLGNMPAEVVYMAMGSLWAQDPGHKPSVQEVRAECERILNWRGADDA